jgi:hypothetical protein
MFNVNILVSGIYPISVGCVAILILFCFAVLDGVIVSSVDGGEHQVFNSGVSRHRHAIYLSCDSCCSYLCSIT